MNIIPAQYGFQLSWGSGYYFADSLRIGLLFTIQVGLEINIVVPLIKVFNTELATLNAGNCFISSLSKPENS